MDTFTCEINSSMFFDPSVLDTIPDPSQITGYKVEFGDAEPEIITGSEESGSDSEDEEEQEVDTGEEESEEALEAEEEEPEEETGSTDTEEESEEETEEESEEISEEDSEEEKESFTENSEESEEAYEAYEEEEEDNTVEGYVPMLMKSSGDPAEESQETETVTEYGSDQLSFITEQNAQSIELLGILSGCALFIVTAELLKYIYKFFRMFF